MNILTAINKKYLPYFAAMIRSLAANNEEEHIVYIATKELTNEDIEAYKKKGFLPEKVEFIPVQFPDEILKGAPTEKRWPTEIYYRIFAAEYLPKTIDRVLYLDSDMIVPKNISDFYNMEFGDNLFVATTNVHSKLLKRIIQIKNGASWDTVYANTGILLMNLKKLREEQSIKEVLKYIQRRKFFLSLPDQDVISTLYGRKILIVDDRGYNLSDRGIKRYNRSHKDKIDQKWIEENAKIIHYLSRNKPWKDTYKGVLKSWYDEYRIDKIEEKNL